MNKRDNMLKALRRQDPEYVPHALTFCSSQIDELTRRTGSSDPFEYFDLAYRYIELNPTVLKGQYDKYFDNLDELAYIDEWGVGWKHSTIAHLSGMSHPMKHMTSLKEIEQFPLPDLLEDYRWEGFKAKVDAVKAQGLCAVYFAVQVFEPTWYLRGMEELLIDMYDDDEKAIACLERVTKIQEALCGKLAEAGIDIIVYGDDVGTQNSLLMSKDIWVKYCMPTMQRCINAAKSKNKDLLAFYHSDGWILPIIDDLIDIGVDILNPVQPECMDPKEIKKLYGDRLSFWGTIGTQTTLPFGTPAEVEESVKEMIETVGKNGGLVIAPSHIVEPEVPWENIVAFYETVKKYRVYK